MYILKYTLADLFPPNKAFIHCNYVPHVWDLTSTHAEWVWTVGQVFRRRACRPLESADDLCGCWVLTAAGELVRRAEDPCGPQLATAAAERGGQTHTLAGHCPSDTHTHTPHIFSTASTHTRWRGGRNRSRVRSRRWVWTFLSFVFFSFEDGDCIFAYTSMRIMVQWMCEVWCIFSRDSISGDAAWLGWPGAKYSHVIWRRSWRGLSRYFLIWILRSVKGGRTAAACAPTALHLWGAIRGRGKKQCVDLLLNWCVGCSSGSRVCAYCCCCCRPVRTGRTTLRGLFDVWQRCCQM